MRPPLSPQNSEDPSSTKRRLSPPPPSGPADSTGETSGGDLKRRRSSNDQGRGKRMFGALMGTLSSFQKQTSKKDSKSVLERRAEIDARVKEKVAKEKEELAVINERTDRERKEEEEQRRIKLETETVQAPIPGHHYSDGPSLDILISLYFGLLLTVLQRDLENSGMLARAHHLYTQCEPKIYYRPYLLLPEQITLIEQQVVDTQAQIDANVEGTTLNRQPRRDSLGRDEKPVNKEKDVIQESSSESQSPKAADAVVEDETT